MVFYVFRVKIIIKIKTIVGEYYNVASSLSGRYNYKLRVGNCTIVNLFCCNNAIILTLFRDFVKTIGLGALGTTRKIQQFFIFFFLAYSVHFTPFRIPAIFLITKLLVTKCASYTQSYNLLVKKLYFHK